MTSKIYYSLNINWMELNKFSWKFPMSFFEIPSLKFLEIYGIFKNVVYLYKDMW